MSYTNFDSLLEGVSSRLASLDQDGRQSLDSIDELVKRNIQDVVEAANDGDDVGTSFGQGGGGSTFMTGYAGTRSGQPLKPATSLQRQPAAASARINSGGVRRTSESFEVNGSNSSAQLDVPGHSEATIRLHKARIKGLEDELDKLTKALSERDQQLAEAKKQVKTLKADQATWTKTQKTLELQVDKYRRAASDAEAALAAREATIKELGKEGGRADKERRAGDVEARARDVRLQRALEDVEKYKAMLGEVRAQDRDGKDIAKSEYNRVVGENKRLERQRAELVVAFKKQLKLIDVLKRQKLHLEAARALQFTEQEFLQTLEMGTA